MHEIGKYIVCTGHACWGANEFHGNQFFDEDFAYLGLSNESVSTENEAGEYSPIETEPKWSEERERESEERERERGCCGKMHEIQTNG